MKLSEIISCLEEKKIYHNLDFEVEGISYDSRNVSKNYIFVSIRGFCQDGTAFIKDAIKNGARAIVTDYNCKEIEGITHIQVPDVRFALGYLSSSFYGFPSKKLNLVGITGTNGKTTISYLLESIYKTAKIPTGVIGTVSWRLGEKVIPAERTTPESLDLQKLLAQAVEEKISHIFMEVSSHGLVLNRLAGTFLDRAVFTNLTEEHLNFHQNMENYFSAKSLIFNYLKDIHSSTQQRIINIDDPYGEILFKKFGKDCLTYGLKNADLTAKNIYSSLSGSRFDLFYHSENKSSFSLPLIGKYNIYNALATIAVCLEDGIDIDKIKEGLKEVKEIPGRLQRIQCGQPFSVIIDYAHTPDALKNLLNTVRKITQKKLILVFGCGGNRDHFKRPEMGKIGVNYSDYVIVTSDNPRNEDPLKIIEEIESGIKQTGLKNYEIVVDRELAIRRAIQLAKENDTVVIAGKGHENYQIIGEKKIPFSDLEVAQRILKNEYSYR